MDIDPNNHVDDDDDDNSLMSYPVVVTPAPSSPDDVGRSILQQRLSGCSTSSSSSNHNNADDVISRLCQGRLWSRPVDPAELDLSSYQNTATAWEQADSSRPTMIRICGMIQDIGETEYVPINCHDRHLYDNFNTSVTMNTGTTTTFVERQVIVIVTDWLESPTTGVKQQSSSPSSSSSSSSSSPSSLPLYHREKRRRQDVPSSRPTTLLLYVYHPPSNHENEGVVVSTTNPILRLHQLIEWIAIQEPEEYSNHYNQYNDNEDDGMMMDVAWTASSGTTATTSDPWGGSDGMTLLTGEDGLKLPRFHVLCYACHPTLDQWYLNTNLLSTTVPSSTLMDTPEAIVCLAQALRVSNPIATALWLTLLSRAEPSTSTTTTTTASLASTCPRANLLGCASLHFVTPCAETAVRFVRLLQTILQPVLPLLRTWDLGNQGNSNSNNNQLLQQPFTQRNGRIDRHPWQLPAGSAVLVLNHHTEPGKPKTNLAKSLVPFLVQHHQIPLSCEGCQQVWLPADWRFIVVSTAATQARFATTETGATTMTTIPLTSWTPFTPTQSLSPRWVRTLTTRRLATPSVALPPMVLERATQDFCRLRQEARAFPNDNDNNSSRSICRVMPREATFHRWLTYTRLWARSRGHAQATLADWEQALQLDHSLTLSS